MVLKDTGGRKILNNEIKYFNLFEHLIYGQYTYILSTFFSLPPHVSAFHYKLILSSFKIINIMDKHTHSHTYKHTVTFSKLSLSHTLMQNYVSHSNSYIYSHTHNVYTYI